MAISSTGSTFSTGTAAGEIIGEITSISFSGITAAEIDVTNLSSSAKSYVLGTSDGGTVEVSCNTTAAQPSLPTAGDASPTSFVVRFGPQGAAAPNQSVLATFTGYIVNTSFEASVDSQVITTYTIQITGAVTMSLSTTV